jgi:hypothetical protein
MLRFRTSVFIWLWMLVVLLGLAAQPAQAQVRAGAQGGAAFDPDQVFFGGHIETSPLVDRLRFRPGVDVGIGDDLTLVGFNFDFTYAFTANRPWNLYTGAGPAINWLDFDGGSDTEGGFNALIGVKNRDGLFFELRIGMVDSPDLKFGVGYTFR